MSASFSESQRRRTIHKTLDDGWCIADYFFNGSNGRLPG